VPGPPGVAGPPGPAGADGTAILDGIGLPPDAIGAVGDYYVDDTGNTMYGPKSSGVSHGAGQSAIPPASTPDPGFSHPTIEIASYVKMLVKGQIVAVRYWRDSSTTQVARKVNVWTTGGTRLATASVANDGGGATSGWKEIEIDPPLEVAINDIVVASVGNTNNYSRKDSATFPISNGGDIQLTQGGYGLTLDVFPNTPAATINMFVDVVFRKEASSPWPVAVPGLPAGGSTGQVLTKTSATDYSTNWQTPAAGGGGSGDVVGPAGAVADRIATFNGTTGKIIKDGGKTLANLTADFVDVGGDTMTGALVVPQGTAAATSLNFGTAGSGVYANGVSNVSIATGGTQRVSISGSQLTTFFPVVVPSAAPTGAYELTHKTYVDGAISGAAVNAATQTALDGKVNDTGDTMTGPLVLPTGTVSATSLNFGTAGTGLSGAGAQITLSTVGTQRVQITSADVTFAPRISASAGSAGAASIHFGSSNTGFYGGAAISATVGGANKLTLTGTDLTTTVPITLPGDPANALQASTKQYADLKVAKTGDTMTGDLTVTKLNPTLVLNRSTATTDASYISGRRSGAARWDLALGNATAETGSNAGSDFTVSRYNDAGTYVDSPVLVTRSTGNMTLGTGVYIASVANRWASDGNLVVSTQGYKPGGSAWADSSDARIKTVDGEYANGLDEVVQLRPVVYAFKGNDTPSGVAVPKSDEPVPYAASSHYQAAKDQRKFVGLVAQEVETIFPEMVTPREGYIDGVAVSDLRELDTGPLIFALVNALKEVKARLEALEAA
jgi:trimeric autotransporter adhesin